MGVDAIGLGTQAQAGGPRRRLVGIEQQDGVAGLRQGVVERLPQAARRLQAEQQRSGLAPRAQPLQQLGVAHGRRRDRGALEPGGASRRLQRADDMGGLGHVDADDAADLGRQHGIHLLRGGLDGASRSGWQPPGLPRAVPFAMGARTIRAGTQILGAGVRPSTVR